MLVHTLATLAVAAAGTLGIAITRRARLLIPFLGILGCLELVTLGHSLYRFGSPADLFPQMPLLEFLSRQPRPFRVLGEGFSLFPNSNVFPALEEIRTHDAVERRDYVDYLDQIAGYDPRPYFKVIRDVNAPGLDQLNVKYLITAPNRVAPSAKWRLVYSGLDGRVFENTRVWPRIFALNSRTEDLASDRLAIAEYRETTNSIAFTVRTPGLHPVVARTSIVSDGGWHARTETGRILPVGKTGRAGFLSITIPPGTHQVHLWYRPPGFAAGVMVSTAVAITAIVAAYAMRFLAKRAPRPPPAKAR
jgi:hypothetical protein